MAYPVWLTPAGSLGVLPEGNFYTYNLNAVNTGNIASPITYTKISGQLPPGISLVSKSANGSANLQVALTQTVDRPNVLTFYNTAAVATIPIGATVTSNNFSTGTTITSVFTSNNTVLLSNNSIHAVQQGDYVTLYYTTAKAGTLEGVPIIVDNGLAPNNKSYSFTVRATNVSNQIADRTFDITITNVIPPKITTNTSMLGGYFDGSFFNYQLEAVDVDTTATLTWSLIGGSLPTGVTLSSNGLLYGYLYPVPTGGPGDELGFDELHNGTYINPFAEYGFNSAPVYRNQTYKFTIQVSDGVNSAQQDYEIEVVARSDWSIDDNIDLVSDNNLPLDFSNTYSPIITTPPQSLPTVRADSNFAFRFAAVDPNYADISFILNNAGTSLFDQGAEDNVIGGVFSGGGQSIASGGTTPGIGFDSDTFSSENVPFPPGLTLDPVTGWLSGYIPAQTANTFTYNFTVQAYETTNPSSISDAVHYQLTVLGDINNTITWTTPSDLGVIDNGATSELSVAATSQRGKQLIYTLATPSAQIFQNYGVTGPASRLPQGLELLPDGTISGRVSFEYFMLDSGATTIDKSSDTSISFDSSYTFTVQAEALDGSVSSTQEFTVRVKDYNLTPYENLYIKALPSMDQRLTFLSIVNNTEIFPEELIYRPKDPWFGRARDMRSLFLAGLTPSELSAYTDAMKTNHYNKRIEFGNVRTARAVDENFNTKYEVVYIPLIDTEIYNGKSPANRDFVDYNINYTDNTSRGFSANIYPNSFQNMQSVIANNLGYANRGALPNWMTAPQTDLSVLGFTRCIVLAYTKPGASNLIAYRMKANGVVFNSIDFVVDRYDLDNALSVNYDVATKRFIGTEAITKDTTFDRIPRVGTVDYSVDYAVSGIPFNMINNRTVAQINAIGGIDGETYFKSGQTIIFAQQEKYALYPYDANDGWTDANGSPIPGYLDNLIHPNIVNKRSGIWQISIDPITNIVTLVFVNTVTVGQQVQINNGSTHSSTILYYNSKISFGYTVAAYSRLVLGITARPTTFDNSNTLFISKRDVHSDPGVGDSVLAFPKTNVLN
jgi:hypothetical protein